MMAWKEEYKRKLVSVEEAVRVVKSGDRVVFSPNADHPKILGKALAARKNELENVEINLQTPSGNPGWFDPGSERSFKTVLEAYIGESARASHDEKRSVFRPSLFSLQCTKTLGERKHESQGIDVFMAVVSPPDRNGYCSFGFGLFNKRLYAKLAKKVVVEVDENQIRTFGNNRIHVSEIDYFVEHTPHLIQDSEIPGIVGDIQPDERREKLRWALQVMDPPLRGIWLPWLLEGSIESIERAPAMLGLTEPNENVKTMCNYAASLVKDGDTIQLGTGEISGAMCRVGALDNKHDLGIHTEVAARGLARLVRQGVVNGKCKNVHQGKIIMSGLAACGWEDVQYFTENPVLELYDSEYVVNIRTVSSNDNQVALNNAVSVDMTGQINAECVFGGRMLNGPGGQPEMHIGAMLSRGGRAMTLLPSTALSGSVSRIVPQFEEGTLVTIPRYFADYIITEYGIASLLGKTTRERADELIAIAHPDFRPELRRAAQKAFYP